MKEEVRKERDQANGRDFKSRDKRNRSPRRDRSRSPMEKRNRNSNVQAAKRVYVANIPFDVHWHEVKDFFRDKIGNVQYCKMFENEEGRSRGCGLVEFSDAEHAKRAIDELHRSTFKDRELVVKEDIDCERDKFGRLIPNKKDKERDQQRGDNRQQIYDPMGQNYSSSFNTYGLSPQFLESLNIRGPLNNRIFVANLDYTVTEKKLEEVFRLAGKCLRVRLYKDKDDVSRGIATVEYEHPVEAVQAISMFHDQNLYGRPMSIRMDKYETDETGMLEVLPSKLPAGLDSIGKGLGQDGQPLNIAKSLLNSTLQQPSVVQSLASQPSTTLTNVQPTPIAQPQISSYNLSTLTNALGQPQNVVGLGTNLTTQQALNTAGLSSLGHLGNLNTSTLSASLGNQNLSQLANTATNVLTASSLTSNSMNPQSLGLTTQNNNIYASYERDYQIDKYRNGTIGQSTISNQIPTQTAATDKVMVRNLPLSYTWQNLKDRFSDVGPIRFCEIRNRGTGYITYENYQDAAKAVNHMNGLRIENKQIEVVYYFGGANY